MSEMPDPTKIFIVHGRDHYALEQLTRIIRALGLSIMSWDEAKSLARKAKKSPPSIQDIIDAGLASCKAIVILISPDEDVQLRMEFRENNDKDITGQQARPNVMFEAGWAWAAYRDRLLIVESGHTRSFSDLDGIHRTPLWTSNGLRQFKSELEAMEFPVHPADDWEKYGTFELPITELFERWKRLGKGYEYLLDLTRLHGLERQNFSSQDDPHVSAYALASAVQNAENVPYWIRANRENIQAVKALIDHVTHSPHVRPPIRAARALECLNPSIVAAEIASNHDKISSNSSTTPQRLGLLNAVMSRTVVQKVREYPETDRDSLTRTKKDQLLTEFESYPAYDSRIF
jgi:hypothetical protein